MQLKEVVIQRGWLTDLMRASRFYTRLPVPVLAWEHNPHARPDFRTMPRALPLAGLMIGLIGAGVLSLGHVLRLDPWLCATFSIASLTFMTGAFHEDGLADSADGLWGGYHTERRLEIMKDSRIGSYGACALILAYALRIGCVTSLLAQAGLARAAAAFIIAAVLSRVAGLVPLTCLEPARTEGASAEVGRPLPGTWLAAAILALLISLPIMLVTKLPLMGLAFSLGLTSLATLYASSLSWRLLQGQTGDIAGAVQQLSEVMVLVGLLIALKF